MAYAVYIRGLLTLAAVTDERTWSSAAESAGDRLLELASPGEMAWGLPFGSRGMPARHPYAITTALACLALHALAGRTGRRKWLVPSREAADWLARGLAWTDDGPASAPWYAPDDPLLTHNVAAQVAAALAEAYVLHGDDHFGARSVAAARYVVGGQHASGLWPYSPRQTDSVEGSLGTDAVVDLVHSSYTVDGLLLALTASRRGGFHLVDGAVATATAGIEFIDRALIGRTGRAFEKVVLADARNPRTAALLYRTDLPRRPVLGGRWLVTFPAESRAWGYGAALSALSRAAEGGIEVAQAPLERLYTYVLSRFAAHPDGRYSFRSGDRLLYPRHESHIFEGLASVARTFGQTAFPPGGATTMTGLARTEAA